MANNPVNKFTILYQLSLADIRERTRRYSFLITMLGVLYFGYLVITGKYSVQFGDCRTIYDSVWAGSLMAVCSSVMIILVGFYLVKGSISRDRKTEVGQIIASTSLSNIYYIISKFFSNLIILWFITAVLVHVAFITLLFQNESGYIDLWGFISPFIFISIPATMFTASAAVLFDTVKWLRGSVGNILYLFIAEFSIVFGMLEIPFMDLAGFSIFTSSVQAAIEAVFPGEKIGMVMGFIALDKTLQVDEYRIFDWNGIVWTNAALMLRLFWIGIAGVVTGLALPFFDRFDPALIKRKLTRKTHKKNAITDSIEKSTAVSNLPYKSLSQPVLRFSLTNMIIAELRLALKGFHWVWYAIALGFVVLQIVTPFEIARQFFVPGAMIWPIVIWSSMGTRELHFNTGQLLFSSPEPVARQFPAVLLSGLLIAFGSVSPMIIRALGTGEGMYALSLIIGVVFVPTLALMFGTLTRSKKMFEVVYLMLWYIGSIDKLTAIDVLGTLEASVNPAKLIVLAILTILFLIIAFQTRRLQVMQS